MPTIDIVIKAVDQATSEIKQISSDLSTGLVEGAASIGEFWALHEGTIKEVYQSLESAYENTVGFAVEYATQVDQIARLTGDTTENASALLQVTGDLDISFSELERAITSMARKGIDPSLESLANLSDEYLALNPGLERTQLLTDTFGRSSEELAVLLSLGSEKIREMTAAVDESMLMTDQAVQQAQEYKQAVNELTGAFDGLKVKIGMEVIPVLLGLITGWEKEQGQIIGLSSSYEEYTGAMTMAGLAMSIVTEEEYNAARAAQELKGEVDNASGAMSSAAGSADNLTGSLNAIPRNVDITITETHRKIIETVESYWSANQWVPEGHQAGGPVGAGRPYIVGEAGPELFVPHSSGQIVPNNELGGVTVNLTYAPGISFADSRELSTRLQPVIIQAIRDAKLRGGYPS